MPHRDCTPRQPEAAGGRTCACARELQLVLQKGLLKKYSLLEKTKKRVNESLAPFLFFAAILSRDPRNVQAATAAVGVNRARLLTSNAQD